MPVTKAGVRKWLWRLVCVLGCFVAVVILLISGMRTYLDWSGHRHWEAVQAMYEREGESFDLRATVPEPVPDDQNFCAIPALKDIPLWKQNDDPHSPLALKIARLNATALPDGAHKAETAKVTIVGTGIPRVDQQLKDVRPDLTPPPSLLSGPATGQPTDMAAWAKWLRDDGTLPMPAPSGNPGRDILAGFAKNDPLIAELAAGLTRPEAQWTPSWKTRKLPEPYTADYGPYTISISKIVTMLGLRAVAEVHAGDAPTALQSMLIALRINQANMGNPFLYGALISCGDSKMISADVWELCNAQSGTDADYQQLQEQLERLDYQKSLLYSMRSEVTVAVDAMGYLNIHGFPNVIVFPLDNSWESENIPPLVNRLIPNGWYEGNTAMMTQWYLDYYIKPLRQGGIKAMLPKQEELWTILDRKRRQPVLEGLDDVMAVITLSGVRGVIFRAIYAQSGINEAIAACALERYRIEHGSYPDSLQAANHAGETSIPMDAISGKSMGYRRTSNGKYMLWCVSLSGNDHGGKRVLDAKAPRLTKFNDPSYTGDWVWDYPTSRAGNQSRISFTRPEVVTQMIGYKP
jgi:hypothetical protein